MSLPLALSSIFEGQPDLREVMVAMYFLPPFDYGAHCVPGVYVWSLKCFFSPHLSSSPTHSTVRSKTSLHGSWLHADAKQMEILIILIRISLVDVSWNVQHSTCFGIWSDKSFKKKKSSVGLHDQGMLNSLYLMLLLNCFSTQTLLHLQTGYCLTLCVQYEQLVHNSSLKMNEKWNKSKLCSLLYYVPPHIYL